MSKPKRKGTIELKDEICHNLIDTKKAIDLIAQYNPELIDRFKQSQNPTSQFYNWAKKYKCGPVNHSSSDKLFWSNFCIIAAAAPWRVYCVDEEIFPEIAALVKVNKNISPKEMTFDFSEKEQAPEIENKNLFFSIKVENKFD